MKHFLVSTLLMTSAAQADVPQIVADIPPVHSLVAQVMGDLGTPTLVVQPGASPHDYALRPSEASALAKADGVIWMGNALTPWLSETITNLANDAATLELGDLPQTSRLEARDDGHDHGHSDHAFDPHQWLDPDNAVKWLDAIAAQLSQLDPENAGTYFTNAAEGKARIAVEISATEMRLSDLNSRPYIVYHDAYQYFEKRFGLASSGALATSDATPPSAADLAHIRDEIQSNNITCIFAEPQYNPRLISSVFEGNTGKIGVLDPLASTRPLGADLYPLLIQDLTTAVASCLGDAPN